MQCWREGATLRKGFGWSQVDQVSILSSALSRSSDLALRLEYHFAVDIAQVAPYQAQVQHL